MSKGKGLTLFVVAALLMGLLVSTAPANKGNGTCEDLFPNQGCINGGCGSFGAAGQCIIINCWCSPGFYVHHNCFDGTDDPECE